MSGMPSKEALRALAEEQEGGPESVKAILRFLEARGEILDAIVGLMHEDCDDRPGCNCRVCQEVRPALWGVSLMLDAIECELPSEVKLIHDGLPGNEEGEGEADPPILVETPAR